MTSNLFSPQRSLEQSLPLQICDLAAVGAAVALFTGRRWAQAIAYFWGLALSLQGLVQPDLREGPDALGFWLFWLHHALIVGAATYVVAVQGFRPILPDLRLAVGAGLAYALPVFLVDWALGVDYGYLGRGLPSQPSLLDWFGPWPWRPAIVVLLAAGVMALLYLPWRSARVA